MITNYFLYYTKQNKMNKEIPIIFTILIAILTWSVNKIIDNLIESPVIKYSIKK